MSEVAIFPQQIRILVADDHQIVRAGISQFIADERDLLVVAEAASGDEVLSQIRHNDFDVILLDISMPDKNGIDTLRVIRQTKPDLPVLVLSNFPEDQYAINMLRAGANGYICKDAPPEEMIRAIRLVARGRRYLSEKAVDLLSAELTQPSDKKVHDLLSEREFQVFHKLAAGRSVTEISRELSLSIKTVSTYRTRLLEKMKFKSNADLTYYAIKNSLLE